MRAAGAGVVGVILGSIAASCDTPLDDTAPAARSAHLDDGACGDIRLGPPSFADARARASVVDVGQVHAAFTLDFGGQTLTARARMRFRVGPVGGLAVFDLVPRVEGAQLDGEPLVIGRDLVRRDPRLVHPGDVLVLKRHLAACSLHELVIDYRFVPSLWSRGGPRWEGATLFFSDFSDGSDRGLLESFAPAPITLADTFALRLDFTLVAAPTTYRVISNGDVRSVARGAWSIVWPEDSDVMTPLFVVARSREWRSITDASGLVVLHYPDYFDGEDNPLSVPGDVPPIDLLPGARTALVDLTLRFGPRRRTDGQPYMIVLAPIGVAGMEFPNGTIMSASLVDVLRHEIIHAWLGRTLTPARHMDAWFDEGITTLLSSTPAGDVLPLDPWSPDATPVTSADPWARRTQWGAHWNGARVFETLIERFGHAPVEDVIAQLVTACRGAHVTHHDLRRAFRLLGDPIFVDTLFERWVIPEGDVDIAGTCAAITRD